MVICNMPTPELAASLKGDTPEETIAALHDYVRSTIRYIADERGENAFVPRAPDVVLERSYGDCKDRAFLVAALARELGYEVDVVLVSTEPEPEFEGTHVGLFNHVINVYDTEDGRQVFFDPTHRYMPYGALPEGDVEGQALRLGAAKAELLRVPSPEAPPALDVSVQAALADMERGVAEVTVRGPLLAYVRQAQERGLALDVENALIAVTSAYLYKMELDDFEETKDDGDAVTFRAQADLSEFAVASPTRRYLPQTPFVAVSAEVLERAEDPYAIHHNDRPHLRLTLDLDAGPWNAAPAEVTLGAEGDPARFAAALSPADEGRTRITYTFRQDRKRLTGSVRDTFVDFARDYLGARRDMFIFRQEPAAEATTGG